MMVKFSSICKWFNTKRKRIPKSK